MWKKWCKSWNILAANNVFYRLVHGLTWRTKIKNLPYTNIKLLSHVQKLLLQDFLVLRSIGLYKALLL